MNEAAIVLCNSKYYSSVTFLNNWPIKGSCSKLSITQGSLNSGISLSANRNRLLAVEGLLFLVIGLELRTVILYLLMCTDALLIELDGGVGKILPVA